MCSCNFGGERTNFMQIVIVKIPLNIMSISLEPLEIPNSIYLFIDVWKETILINNLTPTDCASVS